MAKNDVTNPHDAYFEETQAPWSVSFQKMFLKYIYLMGLVF